MCITPPPSLVCMCHQVEVCSGTKVDEVTFRDDFFDLRSTACAAAYDDLLALLAVREGGGGRQGGKGRGGERQGGRGGGRGGERAEGGGGERGRGRHLVGTRMRFRECAVRTCCISMEGGQLRRGTWYGPLLCA